MHKLFQVFKHREAAEEQAKQRKREREREREREKRIMGSREYRCLNWAKTKNRVVAPT
jgi:hypothetical protein